MFFRGVRQFFNQPWIRAAGVLFSTVVGAGMLSIPYVVSRVGTAVGVFYILGMGLVMCTVHLLIAEIVIRTRTHLQLTGIVRKYIGARAMWLMALVFLVLHIGAMVAYLIGEGESLSALLGGPAIFWTILFFILGTLVIARGSKSIARFDFWMSIATVSAISILVWQSLDAVASWVYAPHMGASLLLPFGVLLFAFHGTSAIPELEMIVGSDARALRKAVLVGSLVPIFIYTIFAVVVVAVTGSATTQVATIGLGSAVGSRVIIIGNLFAVIAMSSSFVTIGQALRRTFQWDYGWHSIAALAAAVGIPLVLYIVGARQFIQVIAFVGLSCGSVEIFLLLWAYWNMTSRKSGSYEKNSHTRGRIRGR